MAIAYSQRSTKLAQPVTPASEVVSLKPCLLQLLLLIEIPASTSWYCFVKERKKAQAVDREVLLFAKKMLLSGSERSRCSGR